MARKPRIHLPGGYYHVMMRGNCGNDIFFSFADRTRFLLLIQEGIERYDHRVHAFCLMDNHVHLLIQVGNVPLSKIIQNLSFRYTRYINRQRKEVGHLFQGRYQAILVDAESYLLELARYIHLNPVRAGLCEMAEGFEWSSHQAYTGKATISWLYRDDLLGRFSSHVVRAQQRFVEFVAKGMGENRRDDFQKGTHLGQILGDDSFAERALHVSNTDILKPPKLAEVLEVVCEKFGVNIVLLYEKGSRSASEVRAMTALIVQDIDGITLTSLAQELERDISTLSQAAGRLRKRMVRNSALKEKRDKIITVIKDRNSSHLSSRSSIL